MRARAPVGILALIVLASAVARALAGLRIEGLWIVPDEMIWGSLGRSLWEDGALRLFGADAPFFGLVYPALAGAPLALAGLEAGYDALKVVQAAVMSLAAVPVFLWGRRLAGERWALAAAALTVAVPGLVFSGMLLSEVVFYPVMVLAAWAMASTLERPTGGRQLVLVGALVLAAATRLQALVLPLALATAVALHALLERDLRVVRRLWPTGLALGVAAAAWVGWRLAAAGSIAGVLGGYEAAAEVSYEPVEVARSTVQHAGELVLATGVVPVAAVLLLGLRERAPSVRAYLATTIALSAWLLVQVGAFTSVYVNGLSGRYLLPLAPLLFLGFSAWLARGGPRAALPAGLVVLGVLGAVVALPLRDLVVQEAAWQSPAVIPLIWLREWGGDSTLELVVWGGAAAALALVAVLPRRLLPVLPLLAAAALAFSSLAATREVQQNVAFDQENLLGGKRDWIDANAGGTAAYLDIGTAYPNLVWHELFWNERLRHVYTVGDGGPSYPLEQPVRIAPDGRLSTAGGEPVRVRFVVAPSSVGLVGEPLAGIEIREYEGADLVLWRLEQPPRVSFTLAGVRRDGDMHEPGRLHAFACQSGRLELTLLPKASTRVEVRVNRRTVRVLDDLAGREFVNLTVPPPPGPEECLFEVVPDGLLGSTRFAFVRD